MSPMCASTCRVQHLSTLSIVSKSQNLPRNMQRRKNFSTSLSFLGASCTICSFEDASMAHLEQLFDKDSTTWPKRLWKQRCGHAFNCKKYLTYQVRIAGDLPHCTLFTEQVQNQLIWTCLAEPQDWTNVKTGCSNGASIFWLCLHFLWLWVLGNWQVRADARRTWKTKTNIESLIQT